MAPFEASSRNEPRPMNFQLRRNAHASHNHTQGCAKEGLSVFSTLDKCVTLPGRRLLRSWLQRPVASLPEINRRQEVRSRAIRKTLCRSRRQRRRRPRRHLVSCCCYHPCHDPLSRAARRAACCEAPPQQQTPPVQQQGRTAANRL